MLCTAELLSLCLPSDRCLHLSYAVVIGIGLGVQYMLLQLYSLFVIPLHFLFFIFRSDFTIHSINMHHVLFISYETFF